MILKIHHNISNFQVKLFIMAGDSQIYGLEFQVIVLHLINFLCSYCTDSLWHGVFYRPEHYHLRYRKPKRPNSSSVPNHWNLVAIKFTWYSWTKTITAYELRFATEKFHRSGSNFGTSSMSFLLRFIGTKLVKFGHFLVLQKIPMSSPLVTILSMTRTVVFVWKLPYGRFPKKMTVTWNVYAVLTSKSMELISK